MLWPTEQELSPPWANCEPDLDCMYTDQTAAQSQIDRETITYHGPIFHPLQATNTPRHALDHIPERTRLRDNHVTLIIGTLGNKSRRLAHEPCTTHSAGPKPQEKKRTHQSV